MKKLFLLFASCIAIITANAQIITTLPAILTNDYNDSIQVIYDASLGTAGLKDYTGTDGIYAHAGVITSSSTSDSDWKHAPAWLTNTSKYKLTSLGNNKYKLLITPNLKSYYGLTTGEVVKKLAFVFRNSTGSKEGKDVGGKDIFVPVYEAGLNMLFSNPLTNMSVVAGTSMDLTVTSTQSADLKIFVNGSIIKSASGVSSLVSSYTFSEAGDYTLIGEASANGLVVRDTVQVCVPKAVVNESLPAGMKQGINYIDNSSVVLVLRAPNKSNVYVIGEFNDWTQLNSYQMKKDGEYWWLRLDGLISGKIYAYQYLVDGSLKISDPYTELVLDQWNDSYINSGYTRFPNLKPFPGGKTEALVATFQINKPAFTWTDQNYVAPDRENMVIYELLLRDFTKEQCLESAMGKLDYLERLGVTAIELMPIQEFDGNKSWGYNPNHYFAPDKYYGTPEMYKTFINECHRRGIAVLLDIVLNHSTGLSPHAKMYWNSATNKIASDNPWFNVDAPHPYSVFNDYNHTSAYTSELFERMVKYWLEEYHVDGYRLDLTKGLTQNQSTEATASNYDQSRIDIITNYYNAAKSVNPNVMFILEHFCSYSEESVLANKGMYLWRNVNYAFSQAAMGYSSGSDFSGMVSSPRQWVGYAESHDEERNFFKSKTYGDGNLKTDSLARVARVPLNMAFATLLPGPKMIYEFEEMGYDYSIDSQGGRVNEKPSAWSWLDLVHRKAAYEASAKIINLRKIFPLAFEQGTFQTSIGGSDWSGGRRISLVHNDLNLVVLGNFSATTTANTYPSYPKSGLWYNLLTGDKKYIGNVNDPVLLSSGELQIWTDREIKLTTDNMIFKKEEIYPTLTKDKIYIRHNSDNNKVNLYNSSGSLLKSMENASELDLSMYPSGVYIVKLNHNGDWSNWKVIKQ